MRIKYILIFSLSILSFFSCKRDGDKYYYINNEEVKKSVSFKEGSYFIYKDSVNGDIDSIWISESNHFQYDVNGSTRMAYVLSIERYEYHLTNKDSKHGIVQVWACNDNGCNDYHIRGYPICNPTPKTEPIFYATDLQVNQIMYSSRGYTIFQNYYDSLLLNGKQHYKVYQLFNKSSSTPKPYDSSSFTSFYSLEEGLLKYSIRTDTCYRVWEILNNHIIF